MTINWAPSPLADTALLGISWVQGIHHLALVMLRCTQVLIKSVGHDAMRH
jgi:hypothetical protein